MSLTEPANKSENAQAIVSISEDRQKAFVTLTEPIGDGKPISSAQLVLDALKASGVVYGIDKSAIEAIVKLPQYGKKEEIARAKLPQNGQNAEINYLFPITSEAKPKILPNGSVDFKQLDLIKNVNAGDPVCSKTPATEGIPGIDVMGGIINPIPGKDVPLPVGRNTEESENGLEILAKISGQVDLLNRRVTVMNVYDIPENVDYNTGNIKFVGNVTIGGDVCTGFSVYSEGNVLVKGCVDGGVVEAEGNVTVINGFNGHDDGKITCGGDLRCKYLQNANVDVGKNLEATSCVNSNIRVGGSAKFIGSQAVILASHVVAGEYIEALNIGSKGSSTGSVLEVGINPRIVKSADDIHAEISRINKTIESLNQLITLYKQLQKQNRLPEEKKAELVKLTATVKAAEENLLNLNAELEDVEQNSQSLGFGTVKALGTVYSGTKIVIGPEQKVITSDCQFAKFTREKDGIHLSPAQP